MDVRWHEGERAGARLWCVDYGGAGPSVLLLHGVAGHAREWDSTATWLARSYRAVAVEQRGHGRSERAPADVSPEAFVQDAEMWIERLGLAPAVLIGQSFGGSTAFRLAARRPDLVCGLVVAEATPAEDPGGAVAVRSWLASWPLPFPSAEHALAFFGGDTLWARAWCDGLEPCAGGLGPAFDAEVVLDALERASAHGHWEEWAGVRCPALVVRASEGAPRDQMQRMVGLLADAQLAEIEDAGHDLHLDQPERWRQAVADFLAGLDR